MSKYEVYPSYRDSGVEWLGDIPVHWVQSKLRYYLNGIKDGTHGSHKTIDKGNLLLSGKNIKNGKLLIKENERNISEIEHKQIIKNGYPRKGDLLVSVVGTIGQSCVYTLAEPISFQRSVCFLRTRNDMNVLFLQYIFQSKGVQSQLITLTSQATVGGVYMGDIVELKMTIPAIEEQQNITNYLDSAIANIDILIEKQTKLIELLKEKRQAVISTAVTRGLDSTVDMKDSGLEWLGDIPEGWGLKYVKYLLNNHIGIKIGPFGSALKLDDMTKEGYKVYGQENVIKRNFSIGHRFISEEKFKSMIVYRMEPDDILITMMGTIGKCIVVPKEHHIGIIDSHLIKIRTNQLMLPAYFVMMIDKSNVVRTQLELNSKGSIMQGLNSSIIKSLLFPLPSITEQKLILDYIDEETSKIDNLITKSTKAIDLLKEKRTALISSAVTGKIDVRNAV